MPPGLIRCLIPWVLPSILISALLWSACAMSRPVPSQPGPVALSDIARQDELAHYQLAGQAITASDVGDALHHLAHIDDPAGPVGAATRALQGGQLRTAARQISVILKEQSATGLLPPRLHVALAESALARHDPTDAAHHLTHLITQAEGNEGAWARTILAMIQGQRPGDPAASIRAVATVLDARQDADRTCATGDRDPSGDGRLRIVLVSEKGAMPDAWRSETRAEKVVALAQASLAGLGVTLEVVASMSWSFPEITDLHAISHALFDELGHVWDEDLLVGLSARDTAGRVDGSHVHTASQHAIVVKQTPDTGHDAFVLVHEIGHHLGLTHKSGTYMQARGVPETPAWSDCQRRMVADKIELRRPQ
jgi:hypothetical protein